MSRVKTSLDHRRIRRLIWLVLAVFVLLGYALQSAAGSAYYSMVMQAYATVSSPEVILQNGTAGTSTIYTNNTSAKVSVEAPLFDYVDDNDPDVDSSADKGTHSNFPAQQAGPDSIYDTLSEENTEGIEDYVDNDVSDVDNSTDIGTHSNFSNMKLKDGNYDALNEAGTIAFDAQTGSTSTGASASWSHTIGTGSNRLLVVGVAFEHNNAPYPSVIDVQYNSVSLTKIADRDAISAGDGDFTAHTSLWYMLNPPSGAHNIEVTVSADPYREIICYGISYEGVKQSAPDDYDTNAVFSPSNDIPVTLTAAADGSLAVFVCACGATGTYTALTDSTIRDQDAPTSESGCIGDAMTISSGDKEVGASHDNINRASIVAAIWQPFDCDLDLEVQFTNVIDFLETEKLCIYTGTLGSEDLRVDYWNGTGWQNLATDLNAYSCNEYAVSLTSATFTIRFRDDTTVGDATQDQWQIDASLLRVEGAGDKEDAVDQQSNIDGSADVGTHSNFTTLKYKDLINDTLTEENTGGATNTTLLDDGFEAADWDANWDAIAHNWQEDNSPVHSGTASAWAEYGNDGYFTCDDLNASSAVAIYVDFWYRLSNTEADDLVLYYYDGSVYDEISQIGGGTEDTWLHYTENVTDSQYFISNFRMRFYGNMDLLAFEDAWVDDVLIKKETQSADDYELDLEIQWIDLPYVLPNETLCVYGGTMEAEDIKVDAWNGTGWETVFNDLSSGWNNASITDWLITSNFTIRFKGGTETGDANETTWQIDVALIHVWHEGGESYELNLEVQWTSADYSRTNEELCIKTGTFSGSENIQVKVWNNTGSSWHWIMNLTASQWNNVSITSYLTSSTFTLQFSGGTETADTTQDDWNIDATLLHVWTSEGTYDYVLRVNNTVSNSWQIKLKKYADSNINRLENCTIYFRNSTNDNSTQIIIENGSFNQTEGPWYNLTSLETIYIAMTVEANSTGTSYVRTYLEIRAPGTTTYAQYIITFEIT